MEIAGTILKIEAGDQDKPESEKGQKGDKEFKDDQKQDNDKEVDDANEN